MTFVSKLWNSFYNAYYRLEIYGVCSFLHNYHMMIQSKANRNFCFTFERRKSKKIIKENFSSFTTKIRISNCFGNESSETSLEEIWGCAGQGIRECV